MRDEFVIQLSFSCHSFVIQCFFEDGDLEFETWNLEFIENDKPFSINYLPLTNFNPQMLFQILIMRGKLALMEDERTFNCIWQIEG
jgi:hypothetical protein